MWALPLNNAQPCYWRVLGTLCVTTVNELSSCALGQILRNTNVARLNWPPRSVAAGKHIQTIDSVFWVSGGLEDQVDILATSTVV